ncbi:uncharacterized protein [Diabrotica undecimpunctata]|uniref:uncharacterized protein n=1 Tax=Diabrotica undecimpunctata TaxID=50387 RepID=UPI003B63539B
MAIPFNLPEEQNEVEVIITQLQYLLMKLQDAIRRSRATNSSYPVFSISTRTRVRTNSSNRARVREESSASSPATPSTSASPSANLPELLNNLAWLAVLTQEAVGNNSQQTTAMAVPRPIRNRTSSESSCCQETKSDETTASNSGSVPAWNQETDNEQSSEDESDKSYSRQGILSRLIPGPVSAPLWTAMICFVGWHIFRAR